jgi:hypothetical protein
MVARAGWRPRGSTSPFVHPRVVGDGCPTSISRRMGSRGRPAGHSRADRWLRASDLTAGPRGGQLGRRRDRRLDARSMAVGHRDGPTWLRRVRPGVAGSARASLGPPRDALVSSTGDDDRGRRSGDPPH